MTEGEEIERKEKLKTKWAQLEAIVGAEQRITLVAEDIAAHYETRLEALEGKAMIVCMSRRICVDLDRELVRLRPDWHVGRAERMTALEMLERGVCGPATVGPDRAYDTCDFVGEVAGLGCDAARRPERPQAAQRH